MQQHLLTTFIAAGNILLSLIHQNASFIINYSLWQPEPAENTFYFGLFSDSDNKTRIRTDQI